ncbi:MAG: N-acetylglucosamine-6-phosphate deacetylase [Pseudanabaenaceae cyanobacterium SKYGB_i_bin29]|nr:N-acetylglucosamine-6-phosphate deacetylase [Pseudanabaenaceae cyanobacterium SKYG29]MDW8421494.1 N-acetylglucosamine-6-phosphate deacetylase [Pseudanabaenaceae cyanobacterium SKYGB_i_bin29]
MEILTYSAGGVDLQINGALGLSFNRLDWSQTEKLIQVCQFLYDQGIDAFLPTLVTTDRESLHRSLSVIQAVMAQGTGGAEILGVHLEGPFLHPEKRGAHPATHLLPLTLENAKRVVGDFAPLIRLMTIAPELDETGEVISFLQNLGIKLSMGHTTCTLMQAQLAYARGVDLVTHLFNAMPSLHHRQPGVVGFALTAPMWCGLIADGKHLHPQVVELVYRLKQHHLFLVSDALPPFGLPTGEYPWDERSITVRDNSCYLADGTLAGTTLGLLAGVINLVNWGVCALPQALALATIHPRLALGLPLPQQPSLVWYQAEGGGIEFKRYS